MGELFVKLFGDLTDVRVDAEEPPLISNGVDPSVTLIAWQYAARHRTWLGVQAVVGGIVATALIAITGVMFWSGVFMAGWGAVASCAAVFRTVMAAAAWRRARRFGSLVAAARINALGYAVWTMVPLAALMMPWPTAGHPFADIPRAVATALSIAIAVGILWWCVSIPAAMFSAVKMLRRVFPGEPTLRIVIPIVIVSAGGYLLLAVGAFIQSARIIAPLFGYPGSWVYGVIGSFIAYKFGMWLAGAAASWVAHLLLITAARRWPVTTWIVAVLVVAAAVAGIASALFTLVVSVWAGAPGGLYPAALLVVSMAAVGIMFGDRAAAAAAADLIMVYVGRPAAIGASFSDI
jgi:hypothetical protein